jgi:hypothetical protein
MAFDAYGSGMEQDRMLHHRTIAKPAFCAALLPAVLRDQCMLGVSLRPSRQGDSQVY